MANLKFERELRDCPYNKALQEKGARQGFIYDFAVMIDGERRGSFHRRYSYRRGYLLLDAGDRPVKEQDHFYSGMQADARDQFRQIVARALLADRIPTLAQIKDRNAEEARKAAEVKAARIAAMQIAQIQSLGPRMLDVLKAFVAKLDTTILVEADHPTSHLADELRQALAVIELAEKPVALEEYP